MLRLSVIILVGIALQSCGIIRDRTDDYLAIKNDTSLVYPPELSQADSSPRYVVPQLDSPVKPPRSFVVPTPPDATAILSKDPFLVERVDDQQWLKLFSPPGQVWPMVQLYFEERGVVVDESDPVAGVMKTQQVGSEGPQTAWLNQLQAGDLEDLRLTVNIEQGLRRNTTDLSIDLKTDVIKENQMAVVESKILKSLGAFLSDESNIARHSLKATGMEVDSLVKVKTDRNGWDYIEVKQSFQRAWFSVLRALEESEVVVSDIDRSRSVIYLDALELEEPSTLASWFTSATSGTALSNNIMISIIDLDEELVQVRVFLLNPQVEENTNQAVLELIYDYIS